jgi:hypothetical protein
VKTYGAQIYCHVCHAEPFPDSGSGFRGTFDLVKVGDVWCCELHRAPKAKRATRVAATPVESVNNFEQILATQTAHLEEALADCDYNIISALKEHNEETGRALGELKEAIAAQKPPPAEKMVRGKRPKPISARERDHEGQGDLILDPTEEGGP